MYWKKNTSTSNNHRFQHDTIFPTLIGKEFTGKERRLSQWVVTGLFPKDQTGAIKYNTSSQDSTIPKWFARYHISEKPIPFLQSHSSAHLVANIDPRCEEHADISEVNCAAWSKIGLQRTSVFLCNCRIAKCRRTEHVVQLLKGVCRVGSIAVQSRWRYRIRNTGSTAIIPADSRFISFQGKQIIELGIELSDTLHYW